MTFYIFKDIKGQWRWHLVAANNRIVANSGEGYFKVGKATRTAFSGRVSFVGLGTRSLISPKKGARRRLSHFG